MKIAIILDPYNTDIQKAADKINEKRKENPEYKKSLELVRECAQTPKAYVYKFKLKDLDIDEGFYTSDFEYVCRRIE